MKNSIKKIFRNIKIYMLFTFLVGLVSVLLVFEHDLSFQKVDNLKEQKRIVKKLLELDKSDIELALIQFNGKSTQLLQEIDKLKMMYKYNITDKYLLGNEAEYFADLQALTALIKKFNEAAHTYYDNILKNHTSQQQEQKAYATLQKELDDVIEHINHMLLKHIEYDEAKFYLVKNSAIAVFAVVLFATFWYRRRLTQIYSDIEYLFQIDKDKKGYEIFSLEADAIALRMNRKAVAQENPSLLDKVTGINNNKGLLTSYAHKKGQRDGNFTTVTVIEIDNFSKTNRPYPEDITQAILKKVAYTISLYEQPLDVIARTDYNQFVIILSRPTKEQAYKDAELIRQSISELKFNIPNQGSIKITVSGGHLIKPSNTNLEEAIKQAKEILAYAKSTGGNKILQTKDLAQRDMA